MRGERNNRGIAHMLLQGVYRLYGLPRVMISDRDLKFVSGF
jgi:hypothetical protein